jgi:hypothetical protein
VPEANRLYSYPYAQKGRLCSTEYAYRAWEAEVVQENDICIVMKGVLVLNTQQLEQLSSLSQSVTSSKSVLMESKALQVVVNHNYFVDRVRSRLGLPCRCKLVHHFRTKAPVKLLHCCELGPLPTPLINLFSPKQFTCHHRVPQLSLIPRPINSYSLQQPA